MVLAKGVDKFFAKKPGFVRAKIIGREMNQAGRKIRSYVTNKWKADEHNNKTEREGQNAERMGNAPAEHNHKHRKDGDGGGFNTAIDEASHILNRYRFFGQRARIFERVARIARHPAGVGHPPHEPYLKNEPDIQ